MEIVEMSRNSTPELGLWLVALRHFGSKLLNFVAQSQFGIFQFQFFATPAD